jgi:hypothetical protein
VHRRALVRVIATNAPRATSPRRGSTASRRRPRRSWARGSATP